MKMPRSQSENENVQFVQELAEVDGPFESPININFRDLTKLELPALVWNRGDTRPKKMKITNTGHTVIISGKWKSERPYLTGGPLTGKYVFSQIHFHWGQDNTTGSEHQVCGEGYPLEMHVAHFKTEYLTQECALREKDGMVVVVYLFKLQEEPNSSLKKIINLLPCVKQASTSHAIDPRPILSLCNPFTEDYFMYWGSVVTSTCAHILLWVICREPFGISRDQINEFRKIMDSSQQPICRNNRDIQPLHKRNVFHVNASKYLDEPLLPVKKILGCYCRGSQDNISFDVNPADCTCQINQNQEEVEGMQPVNEKLPSGCFGNETIVVQTAAVHSVSVVLKRFGSDTVDHSSIDSLQPTKSQDDSRKLTSQSCCFFSTSDIHEIKSDKRKIRDRKRPFNSLRAFSQIISSLEALKTHTFKKLKEIESINQEIKGIRPLFQEVEDKQWLRKIEKMMSNKKGFTMKTSQGCLNELKKLARECNFDKFFDKSIPETADDEEIVCLPDDESGNVKAPNSYLQKEEMSANHMGNGKVIFPEKAQKLIRSFFEDIRDNDDLQEKDFQNFCSKQAGDSNSVSSASKGYITQNMFKLGNLGDRFFTEVEDVDMNKEKWENEKQPEKLLVLKELNERKNSSWSKESQKITTSEERHPETEKVLSKTEQVIPLHRANVSIAISKTTVDSPGTYYQEPHIPYEEKKPSLESLVDKNLILKHKRKQRESPQKTFENIYSKRLVNMKNRELFSLANERLMRALEGKSRLQDLQISSSNFSTDSLDTQSMLIAKLRRKLSRKDYWPFSKSSVSRITKISPKRYGKIRCKKFEGYYIENKNMKERRTKRQKRKTWHTISSNKDWEALILNSKMKRAKFKLQIQSTSNTTTTTESDLEKPISPERKKLRLETKKLRIRSSRGKKFFTDDELTDEETKGSPTNKVSPKEENLEAKSRRVLKPSEIHSLKEQDSIRNVGRGETIIDVSRKPPNLMGLTEKDMERQEYKSSFRVCPNGAVPKAEPQARRKPMSRNNSLLSMNVTPRTSSEFTQRLQVEYLDDRRRSNKENFEFRSSKQSKEFNKVQSFRNLFRGVSNVTYRKSDGEPEQGETVCVPESKGASDTPPPCKLKHNVGFLTRSSQVDEGLLLKEPNQEEITKNVLLKRCDAEKYTFLQKVHQEKNLPTKDPNENPNSLKNEILYQTDSNKSFGISKGDKEAANAGNKDLQTSVSYRTLKKNSPSRSHSAETLNFLMKSIKRKYKKRPHCCKRNSIHYIRKKSSKKFEEVIVGKVTQENAEVTSLKETRSLGHKHRQQEEVSKPTEKEVKTEHHENKRKVKSSKFPVESKKEKIQKPGSAVKKPASATPKTATTVQTNQPKKPVSANQKPISANQTPAVAVKKPVNDFIKLNKQLAGKYRRPTVPTERKPAKPKEQRSQTKQKLATPKTVKSHQRNRGKIPVRKPDFEVQSTSQTPLPDKKKADENPSPKTPKVESPGESRTKSLGCLTLDRFSDSHTFALRPSLLYSD